MRCTPYLYNKLLCVLSIWNCNNYKYCNTVHCLCTCIHLLSGHCRDEFDEEKEPDGMVLAGWSGPVDKQITSNGDERSVPSSSSADDVDSTAEDASAKPGMKRKLNEILESKENFDTLQNKSDVGSSSAQIVEDDDDDMIILSGDPMQGKKKRLQ